MPFSTELKISYVDGVIWELIKPLVYIYDTEENIMQSIEAEAGFRMDMASIPRPFWFIIGPPTGKYAPAATIHDWLYAHQTVTRKEADRIFLLAMKDLGVAWWKRRAMYYAVRWFAFISWNKHKERLDDKKYGFEEAE